MQNENETLIIDPGNDYFQGKMFDFRKAYHSERYNSCTACIDVSVALATILKEEEYLKRIIEIREGLKVGVSMAYLEYHIFKSVRSENPNFKVRINDVDNSRGRLNEILTKAKGEIYLICSLIEYKHKLVPKMDWLGAIEKGARVSFDDLKI